MGNVEIKTAFKNAIKDQSEGSRLGLNPSIVFEDKLVSSVKDYIFKQMKIPEDFSLNKFFPDNNETNVSDDKDDDDHFKKQLISELNDSYISGFASAESLIESFNDPTYKKYFTVSTPSASTKYNKLQQHKLLIVYALYVEKFKDNQDKKIDFFEYIKRFLAKQESVSQRVQVGLESGFKFSLALLKEIKSISKEILVNSLEHLYQSLRQAEPCSLYGTDKLSFMLDSNLNEARSFLLSLIKDPSSCPRTVELSYKIILLVGIARANVEDLLLIQSLLQDLKDESIDLTQELKSILQSSDQSQSSKPVDTNIDFSERVLTKSGTMFYLKADGKNINSTYRLAVDQHHIYMYSSEYGFLKLSNGSQPGDMLGHVVSHSQDTSLEIQGLTYLNGSLYASIKKESIVPIDQSALTLDLSKAFKLKRDDDKETGRKLVDSPLFTDGQYLYLVSFKQEVTQTNPDEGSSDLPPALVIEAYEPSEDFKLVKQVTLYKNESKDLFVKQSNSESSIFNEASFATNGEILMYQTNTKAYFFNMKTGVRVFSDKIKSDFQKSLVLYDSQTNVFYTFQIDQCVVKTFVLNNFQKGKASFGFDKEYLSKRLSQVQDSLYGDQSQSANDHSEIANMNLIEQLMFDIDQSTLINQSKNQQKKSIDGQNKLMQMIILAYVQRACAGFESKFEELTTQGKVGSDDVMMNMFKYPNATYLTSSMFKMIQSNLISFKSLIQGAKHDGNLCEQYCFYFLLKLILSNFQALSYCSLSLSTLLKESAFESFQSVYQECIVSIVKEGYSMDRAASDEVRELWNQIHLTCVKILQNSINMIFKDTKDVIENLQNNLGESLSDHKKAENSSIALNYLSSRENIMNLLQNEPNSIHTIFKACGQLLLDLSLSQINSLETIESSIGNSTSNFVSTLSEQVLVQYCALSDALQQKVSFTEKDESDKKKLKVYENVITSLVEVLCTHLAELIKSINQKMNDNFASKESLDTEAFKTYCDFISKLLKKSSPFCSQITLFTQTFALNKLKASMLSSISSSLVHALTEMSNFYYFYAQVVKKDESVAKSSLKKFINKVSRNISWFIGMTAYKLIKIKNETVVSKENEGEQKNNVDSNDLIVQSNLLSGGIELRFVNTFSQDTLSQMLELLKICDKKGEIQKLIQMEKQSIETEDDKLIQAIIHSGQNPIVDQVLTYLQQILERKIPMVPYARLSGTDGLKLSRAAFAVMIKFSEHFESFQHLIDDVDITMNDLEGDSEKDIKLKDHIKQFTNYDGIFRRWELASKMRQWIQENKKEIIERIKKEVENQNEGLDEEAKDQLADSKFNEELEQAHQKVIEKAEFLVKLRVPPAFLARDASKERGALLFLKEAIVKSMNGSEQQVEEEKSLNWREKMKHWRQVQTSKGAIKSFTEKKKELFDSAVTSILAYLQTPLNLQKIRKTVETIVLNATKRVAGLKILSDVMGLDVPQKHKYDLICWFTSSLRGNKSQLAHYIDDLKGCGHQLEDMARENFFYIIKALLKQLKTCNNEDDIKIILSSLKWNFVAKDHANLKYLDIFHVLHSDGNQSDVLKKAWGRSLPQTILSDEKERTMPSNVLLTFEHLFLAALGRIIKPESGEIMKIKGSGAKITSLEKARSVIDENVSESLIAQAFEVIYKELNRYVKITSSYHGIEWSQYIQEKLKDVNFESGNSDTLLDEDKVEDAQISTEGSSKDEITSEEIESCIELGKKVSEKQAQSLKKLYNEKFLLRLLRLMDIFTSIATVKSHPLSMVQRVANPQQVQTLIQLILYGSPKIKHQAMKIILNLIKMSLPMEIFEESIKSMTKEPNSLANQILNNAEYDCQLNGSLFLRFIINYVVFSRNKMWTKSGIESHGQYAVTQELIQMLRYIHEQAPQEDLKSILKKHLTQYLTQQNPETVWQIEYTDVYFSILEAGGGSFDTLMVGSHALHKETQPCVVIGFSDKVKVGQNLLSLENEILPSFTTSFYCNNPSTEKALVVFAGKFQPEVRAVDVSSLIPVNESFHNSNDKSLFYDFELLKSLDAVLSIDVDENTPLSIRQSQVQIVKNYTNLVEVESKQNGSSSFLKFLNENGLLKSLFSHLQRNASKPQLLNKDDLNLPTELLELYLTQLRIKANESHCSIMEKSLMKAILTEDDITFFEESTNSGGSLLRICPIHASLNEEKLHPKLRIRQDVMVFNDIKENPILVSRRIDILAISSDDLLASTDLAIQAITKCSMLITDNKESPEKVYFSLKNHSSQINSQSNHAHLKTCFMISQDDLNVLYSRNSIAKEQSEPSENTCKEQFNQFLSDLKEWANVDEKVIKKGQSKENDQDRTVTSIQKLMKLKLGDDDNKQNQDQKENVKKLLVGKMASLGRKQTNQKKDAADIGRKIWDKVFQDINVETHINTNFNNLTYLEAQNSKVAEEKSKAFSSALTAMKNYSDNQLQQKYVETLNKLIRLRSRTAIVSFLYQLDPIPQEVLQSFDSLEKLILISFNEAVNIQNLTGNKHLLKLVTSLLTKIILNPQMRDFVNDFLNNHVLRPSIQVMKKIKEDKEFMKTQDVFESEVDASMYPLPYFVYKLLNTLFKSSPQTFLDFPGLIHNSVSVLIGHALARVYKDSSYSNYQIKFLTLASDLLGLVRANPEKVKDINDIYGNKLLSNLGLKLFGNKVKNSKSKEQMRLMNEVFYEWIEIRKWYEENHKDEKRDETEYEPNYQHYRLARKIRYLKHRDPADLFVLMPEKDGSLKTIRTQINEATRLIKSHPEGYKVPFICKVKAMPGSLIRTMKLEEHDNISHDDTFKYYLDKKAQCFITGSSEDTLVARDYVYLSYQKSMSNQLIFFGNCKKYKLPNSLSEENTYKTADHKPELSQNKIVKIESCANHTVMLSETGIVYHCGQIKGTTASTPYDTRDWGQNQVKLVTAGKMNIAIVRQDNKIEMYGYNKNGHFEGSYDTCNFYFVNQSSDYDKTDDIIDICSGTHFTLYVTKSGLLFGSGNFFLNELNVSPDSSKFVKIPLPEGIKAQRVWCSRAKNCFAAIIEVKNVSTEEQYLMSAGIHFGGWLGQGTDDVQSNSWKKIDYDHTSIKFKKISTLTQHVFAVTEDGDLYGWGLNDCARLGMDILVQTVNKPTLIPFFSDKERFPRVIDVAAGFDHSFVHVEERISTGELKLRVYQVGYNYEETNSAHRGGCTKEELEANRFIVALPKYDGYNIKTMSCGFRTSFILPVLAEMTKQQKTKTWVENYVKNECKPGEIKNGYLHLYHTQDEQEQSINTEESKGWKFLDQSEVSYQSLPAVSLAIRHQVPHLYKNLEYLKDILTQAQECLDLSQPFNSESNHGVVCSETGQEIKGSSRYYASYMNLDDTLVEFNVQSDQFFQPLQHDYLPLVHFRLGCALKPDAKLPIVDLNKLYGQKLDEGKMKFSFKVSGDYKSFSDKKKLMDMFADLKLSDNIKKALTSLLKYSSKYEKQVQQFALDPNEYNLENIDEIMADKKKEILRFFKDPNSLAESDAAHKKVFEGLSKIVTEENYSLMQISFFECQAYFNIAKKMYMRISDRSMKHSLPDSLPVLRKKLLANLPGFIKKALVKNLIDELPTYDRTELTIRRRKAMEFAETGACDHEGTHTIFGQIMQYMKKNEETYLKCFKQNATDAQMMKVEFKGEGSIDAGGPYRETITNICNELQSAVLPLLIPSPNNKNNHGQNRECWIVNLSSNSPTHLEMFKYFGYYIGFAIRSQQALPLDLAPIFWKLLINEIDSESDIDKEMDLKAFDTYSWQVIEDLRNNTMHLSEEDFEAAIEEYFVTLLSNGEEVELVPGGRNIKVTKQNLNDYIRLVVDARINEASKQMKAIRDGVNYVIPMSICKMMNSKQIEIRATGSKSIDLEKLKSITNYENCQANDECIQIFWRVMESFSDEERSLYLKFVWGRARLPATTESRHKIVALTFNQNSCLPVSHTCFFTLDLPKYPTFELARDKILFAIRFCGDIDADRAGYDIGADE